MTSEKKKPSKLIDLLGLVLFCVVIIGAAVLLVTSIRSKTIDLSKYVTVEFSGANGQGEAKLNIDEAKFEADWEEKIEKTFTAMKEEVEVELKKNEEKLEKTKTNHPEKKGLINSLENSIKDAKKVVAEYDELLNSKGCAKNVLEKYMNLSLISEKAQEAQEALEQEEEDATKETEIGEDPDFEEETESTEAESTEAESTEEDTKAEDETESAADDESKADEETEATEEEEKTTEASKKPLQRHERVATDPVLTVSGLSNGEKVILQMRGIWDTVKKQYAVEVGEKEAANVIKDVFGLWINFSTKYKVSGLN